MNQAELVAQSAKAAFDAAQLLEDAPSERVRALSLVREALLAAKEDILKANALDMDVRLPCAREPLGANADSFPSPAGRPDTSRRRDNVELAPETLGLAVIIDKVRRHASRSRGCCKPR
jgi:hypothetical protein